ncbi:hypothetical protein B0H10DRAFT_2086761 [Mycena sp. CBHHK59/15]|nr:hypothetical protein B0H10DRAFT_2086761 [Mycena sp. CBHHK59/15]
MFVGFGCVLPSCQRLAGRLCSLVFLFKNERSLEHPRAHYSKRRDVDLTATAAFSALAPEGSRLRWTSPTPEPVHPPICPMLQLVTGRHGSTGMASTSPMPLRYPPTSCLIFSSHASLSCPLLLSSPTSPDAWHCEPLAPSLHPALLTLSFSHAEVRSLFPSFPPEPIPSLFRLSRSLHSMHTPIRTYHAFLPSPLSAYASSPRSPLLPLCINSVLSCSINSPLRTPRISRPS